MCVYAHVVCMCVSGVHVCDVWCVYVYGGVCVRSITCAVHVGAWCMWYVCVYCELCGTCVLWYVGAVCCVCVCLSMCMCVHV